MDTGPFWCLHVEAEHVFLQMLRSVRPGGPRTAPSTPNAVLPHGFTKSDLRTSAFSLPFMPRAAMSLPWEKWGVLFPNRIPGFI